MHTDKKPLTLSYDNLVIGSTLEALYFSYYNNIPLVYTKQDKPYYFESYKYFSKALESWNNFFLTLSLAGLIPFSDKCNSITYIDNNTLKIISSSDKSYTIKFKNIWVFDDYNFNGLPPYVDTKKTYMIVDHLRILEKWPTRMEDIKRDENFINSIYFFKYKDYSKVVKYKDFYAVSYAYESEKYPEYLIKIKSEEIIGGVKVEHKKREIKSLSFNKYEDFDNVKFCYLHIDDMFEFSQIYKKMSYQKYLMLKLKL